MKFPFLNPELPLETRINDLVSRLTLEEKMGFIPTRNQAVERLGIDSWAIGAEGAHGFVNREGRNTAYPQTIGLASSWDRDLLKRVGEAVATEARIYYQKCNRRHGLSLWSPTIDLERDPRWGRTEEGYGEDPFLVSELSSAYIRGAQGDDPFYLRVSCGPKHFFANNNEYQRINCSCSITQRCLREYYLVPFKAAIKDAKAASLMTAYNEVNGIPMMLHPILKDIVKGEWELNGHIVTDGGDFIQTVTHHNYFETHAQTLAAALINGADSMTDQIDNVIPAVKEALDKKLITEAELDEHIKRILNVRFRLGHFDPKDLCPYDSIIESDSLKEKYIELTREAVRKSIVLLKNDNNILPLHKDKVKTIAVIGPLSNTVHLDWYSSIPPYTCTPFEGLRDFYGNDRIIHCDHRDLVSFTSEDGRPLILKDTGKEKGKTLCVGKIGDTPARFFLEDWGWGSQTLTDIDSGLLLESPLQRKENISEGELTQLAVTASGKNSHSWHSLTVFNLIPQENGLIIIRTFDNRRLKVTNDKEQVLLNDDPLPGNYELFRMKIEKEAITYTVEAAKKAEKVIFVGGNNPMINGRECIDRISLDLPPPQQKFIDKIFEVNKNIIFVLISGYPYSLKDYANKIPVILWMAHGIQETGRGLTDIINGTHSPAGRLPLTWYENENQLPSIMEYDIISAGTTYLYFKGKTLYPFGYGLGYSKFAYSDLKIDKKEVNNNDIVRVSFNLKNIGKMRSSEVPQLYISIDLAEKSKVKMPLKTLKGFDRIAISPGELKNICFELPVKELGFWDAYEGRFIIGKGKCNVFIGSSSQDVRLTGSFKINGEEIPPRKIKSPIYAERFDNYANCFLHEKRGSGIPGVFSNSFAMKKGQESFHTEDTEKHGGHGGNGSWIYFANLDFSKEFSSFSAIVQGNVGSFIEIRLDKKDGFLMGTLCVPNTGDTCDYELSADSPRRRQLWSFAEIKIEKISGVHDLYLILQGKTGIWRFEFTT